MQDFYLVINWLVTVALLALGIVTLLKNGSLLLNKVFTLFTVAIGIWIMASYISNDVANSPHTSVIGNYFVFFFSYLSGYLLLWFATALARDTKVAARLRKATIPILAVGATTCTPLVVAGATRQGDVYAVKFGPLAILYFGGLVILLSTAMIVLHRNIKRAHGEQRAHMVVLYSSMMVALPILLITEFILPAVTGWFGLTNVGILAMGIPVVGLYYSVVKFRLFDLRLIIVRSVAYVVTLSLLAGFYGIASYYATSLLVGLTQSNILKDALNSLLIIVIIVAYPRLRRRFDQLTNRLFYRDAYDPQVLFDNLNKLLISSVDVKYLMTHSASLLENELKSGFVFIGLRSESRGNRIFAVRDIDAAAFPAANIQQQISGIHQKVIVGDYLDESRHPELHTYMHAGHIEVIVRLTQNITASGNDLGYIMLGEKKSGNPYSKQDARTLEAVANELILAIQNALHYEEVQKFNEVLQARVDAATRKYRTTNEKLKALDETKDDFISMASHQLRTPLTSVKGYLSMVIEGDAGEINDVQKKMLNQAFVSSQRMVYLIADLLNVSRLKTGKFVIEPAPTNLAHMVSEEIDQLVEAAASRNIELTYDKPKNFPALDLDETKTRQVIMNFVDNAIYYTPSGGHIRVELDETPTSIELKVIDDGMGVPKSEQHHLFTKFYRAGNARKARPDGTGLGLFMAKKVILAQGGSILFESHEGKGSTFGFLFPKHGRLQASHVPVIEQTAAK